MEPETQTTPEPTNTPATITTAKNNWLLPATVLVGFAMIAAAIYFSGGGGTPQALNFDTDQPSQEQPTEDIRPIDEDDHIRGNPNAPIVFVEYSDYDCPFCKRFHDTMNQIMDEYGADGKVAWVYRHLPLEQLHPNAPKIAEASECVAELGGNDAFWEFSDLIFDERGTNEPTDMTALPGYAAEVGVDQAEFTACLDEGRYADRVEQDLSDGAAAGIQGTPHTFVQVGGQQGTINGAQPYEVVQQLTENLLAQIEGTE